MEPRCSAWLAAYALDLAHTTSSGEVAVRELLARAAGRPHLLCEARDQLGVLVEVAPDLRDRTCRLLTEAVRVSGAQPSDV